MTVISFVPTHTIEVTYTTGNSFHSEIVTENVNLVFFGKEFAQKALAVIKEHQTMILEYGDNNRTFEENNEIGNAMPWCKAALELEGEIGKYHFTNFQLDYWQQLVAVEVAKDEWRRLSVSQFTGHFETLHSASIVSFKDDVDSFSF
ncbi:hypothetical protein GD1_182 [Paraglaciecola Antarctic GD virus 1]|nr:hypothetical protein GD1_182 [Paraglaciecola Antarctic GD virus 1]